MLGSKDRIVTSADPTTVQGTLEKRMASASFDQLGGVSQWKEAMGHTNSKDLLTRALGRFYTPELIGRRLAEAVTRSAQLERLPTIDAIDPFCGDGRLICWLLESVAAASGPTPRTWNIELWDCDEDALRAAKQNVLIKARELGEDVEVRTILGDTFDVAQGRFGEFTVCITNPPWEVLKPDRRELQALGEDDAREYVVKLRAQSERLSQAFPRSAPRRKYAGWGINLARTGTEIALRLTAVNGACGIVSPASLLADQMSRALRRWLFEQHSVQDIAYYAAEAKLFDKVDQPSVTLVLTPNSTNRRPPEVATYNGAPDPVTMILGKEEWHSLQSDGYVFPLQFGLGLLKLRPYWENLSRFADLEDDSSEGLWAGRELDETGHKRFLVENGNYLFAKGRMVGRFTMCGTPSQYIDRNGPRIPATADHYRLAWRDVSRPNQKRRMQATIIPPGTVTGNSLHVAYFKDDDLDRLKALLAIVNSFVFEAQVRMRLATAHVSLGVVREACIPPLEDRSLVVELARLVDLCQEADRSALIDVEVRVARLYGLSREVFSELLAAFDKVDDAERSALMSSAIWRRYAQ